MCLAVADGGRKTGVVLHVTPGSATTYVEPQAAIPLNNSLAAARGEAYAAVEAVLWRLSGLVMAVVDSLAHILETVAPSAHHNPCPALLYLCLPLLPPS